MLGYVVVGCCKGHIEMLQGDNDELLGAKSAGEFEIESWPQIARSFPIRIGRQRQAKVGDEGRSVDT